MDNSDCRVAHKPHRAPLRWILAVKFHTKRRGTPGITDLASIAFRNESELLACSPDPERTYVEQILPTKLRYATQYVHTHSLWLDLQIIAWTVLAVLGLHSARHQNPADNP